jgi:hypothetical protein
VSLRCGRWCRSGLAGPGRPWLCRLPVASTLRSCRNIPTWPGVSGANQYTVKPLALASCVVPPIVMAFSPVPVAAGAGRLAPAVATPSSTSAAAASAAAAVAAARATAGGIRAGSPARPAAAPLTGVLAGAGASTSAARTANAATSITPATMPAVVRTSWKPNSKVYTDRR